MSRPVIAVTAIVECRRAKIDHNLEVERYDV
jgi:hypothetical protein